MNTQSENINELAAALSKAQGSMQNAVMNRTNPHFKSKYADLSSVLDAIRAPLSASGRCTVDAAHRHDAIAFLGLHPPYETGPSPSGPGIQGRAWKPLNGLARGSPSRR